MSTTSLQLSRWGQPVAKYFTFSVRSLRYEPILVATSQKNMKTIQILAHIWLLEVRSTFGSSGNCNRYSHAIANIILHIGIPSRKGNKCWEITNFCLVT